MRTLFVATFPAKHFELYGEKFLDSLSETLTAAQKTMSSDFVEARVWVDGIQSLPASLKNRLTAKRTGITVSEYHDSQFERDKFVAGVRVEDQTDLDIAGDVSKQIIRWSFKGMMQLYALQNFASEFDYVVYIDSDTVFRKPIDRRFVSTVFPNQNQVLSAVFRKDIDKYTETGWIVWNTNSPDFQEWVELYRRGWFSHEYEKLDGYHDCAILDWACSHFPNKSFKNLSGGGDHGFVAGPLGDYLDHKKGVRKFLGFSFENIPLLNNKFGRGLYKLYFLFLKRTTNKI